MIEYYNDIPETHHEIGALDYMRFTGAPYLASVHSKLKSHKDNERVHITDEERDKWNHKVDKTTFYELENKVLTKAEKKEIPLRLSQLQNDVPYLTSADINIKLNSENYITKGDLDSKGYITSNDLSRYATKDYVDNRGYLTQSALANYVTQAQFTAAMAAITPGGSGAVIDLSNYYTKSEVDNKIRTAIDNIVIDGDDTDITERIVRTWIDEAYSDAEEDIKNEVLNSSELENKITLITGEKIEAEGGMTQALIAALQLASDRAAMLVETINGNEVIKSAGIVAAINANNDSAVKINADHIILDGATIANAILATSLDINNHNTVLNSDGSGSIANGAIAWDATGDLTQFPDTYVNEMSFHGIRAWGVTCRTVETQAQGTDSNGLGTGIYINNNGTFLVYVDSNGYLKVDTSILNRPTS